MTYQVAALRSRFPALGEGAAHFDSPGGSQVPDSVGAAVAGALTSAIANRGRLTAAERRADDIVTEARRAVGDLLGADPGGVIFGRSMTALTYDLSRAMARDWRPGDEVVVTRLDHDANIRPWVQAAAASGATVRWADFDASTGALPVERVTGLISERTRLVAVTGASNLLGTRPDVRAIAARAHEMGAQVYLDGVHLTAHAPVDLGDLGADFYACSPYKWLGPHCGVVAASPAALEVLHPDKLVPSTEQVPERFELGTLPYEILAGVTAAVDFIAGLGELVGAVAGTGPGTRRERITASMLAAEAHEDGLRREIERRLAEMPGVVCRSGAPQRTPTLLLTFPSDSPSRVSAGLAALGVNAPAGSFYALEASRHLGLGDEGGLRVGLAPYTDQEDVERLISGLREVLEAQR